MAARSKEPSAYAQVTRTRVQVAEKRLAKLEEGLTLLHTGIDNVKDTMHEQHAELVKVISDHAEQDNEHMAEIRKSLERRVPAWAAAMMAAGGGLIGGLLVILKGFMGG